MTELSAVLPRSIFCLAALGFAWVLPANGGGPDEPAANDLGIRTGFEIMQIAEKSKINYVIEVKVLDGSSTDSALADQAVERPPDLSGRPRVSVEGGNVSLGEWTCTQEAEEHLAAGEKSFNGKDYKAARASYLKAVASDPECYIANAHVGDTFILDGNDTMAIVHYDRAIELNPLDHKTFAYRGRAHLRQGDGEFALEDFRSSLTLRPHYWLTANILENSPYFPVVFNDLRLSPPVRIETVDKKTISIEVIRQGHDSWIPYALCKAVWFGEGLSTVEAESALDRKALRKDRKRRAKSRGEGGTQFDYGEEFECMMLALESYLATKEDAASETNLPFIPDESLEAFERAVRAGFTSEALLYGIAAQRFGQAMLMLGQDLRQQMRDFVAEMVLYPEDG